MSNLRRALDWKYPNSKFSMAGDTITEWIGADPQPTQAEIATAIVEYEATELPKIVMAEQLAATDKEMARVGEDAFVSLEGLLDTLVAKGALTAGEANPFRMDANAKSKINARRAIRGQGQI